MHWMPRLRRIVAIVCLVALLFALASPSVAGFLSAALAPQWFLFSVLLSILVLASVPGCVPPLSPVLSRRPARAPPVR